MAGSITYGAGGSVCFDGDGHSLYTDSGIILASVSDFRSIGEGIIAEVIRPASALGGRRVASIRAGKKWAQARAGVR